jgi:hypothetical protein
MPEKETLRRARKDKRAGKAASTQAGEFVREEIEHIRKGEHGARSTKQAIAIGLSKARRAGVDLPAPKPGQASEDVRERAEHDREAADEPRSPSRKRARAVHRALERESREPASRAALSRHAKTSARKRGAGARKAAARKAARTRARSK